LRIIDAHCDVLGKLTGNNKLSFYKNNHELHVQYSYLKKSDISIQTFALFIPPRIPSHHRFHEALRMVDTFYQDVVRKDKLIPIQSAQDLEAVLRKGSKVKGGLLALEGADALQGNILYLRILYQLGIRLLGFTWNHRNEAADGVEEPNPGGLSAFGVQILQEANRLGMVLDVSHLSEKGFWDVLEYSSMPVIASHSNCRSVCEHPRNLTDSQLVQLFRQGGMVGLTFVPHFISSKKIVMITDLLRHLEHALSLGGENHIGFGSDFDGIDLTMGDLKNASCYPLLVNTLLKFYKEDQVKKWLKGNWESLLNRVLN
jgi:membrane dipeptidase